MDILNRPTGDWETEVHYARKEEHIQDESCKYDHKYEQQQSHQHNNTREEKAWPKPTDSVTTPLLTSTNTSTYKSEEQLNTLTDKTLLKLTDAETKSAYSAKTIKEQQQQHNALTDKTVPQPTDTVTTSAPSKSTNNSFANDGLSLKICGKGELVILFPEANGSGEKGQDNVGKISLSVECATPLALRVPTVNGFVGVDVQCRGSINLCLGTHGNGQEIPVKESNSKTDSAAVEHNEGGPSFTKNHRRNNSDFIFVSGEATSVKELLINEDTSKTAPTVSCANASNAWHGQSGCCSVAKPVEINAGNYIGTDVGHVCSELTKLEIDFFQTRNSGARVNLNGPIRENFTRLLQEICLIPLCDHLYENRVIDMETYQSLNEGTKNGMTTQDGIRKLLMTLSTMSVKKGPLLKALLESDHKDIIRMLLPT